MTCLWNLDTEGEVTRVKWRVGPDLDWTRQRRYRSPDAFFYRSSEMDGGAAASVASLNFRKPPK